MDDIKKLIKGFKRFRGSYFDQDNLLFKELRQGQSPRVMMVACSDSRVDPALLTHSQPGELFMVRNVANLVPPHEWGGGYHGVSAALEYAVCVLNVSHIVVQGHRQCGGIKALLNGIDPELHTEYLDDWVQIAERAKKRVLAEYPEAPDEACLCLCEKLGVLVSLDNLMTFPWIRERVEKGKLNLHGWYFDLETGDLLGYNQFLHEYEPLV